MARIIGHFSLGMRDAKKMCCVQLFLSVIFCVVMIIFSTFFIQMSTTHLNPYPWTTSTTIRYNSQPITSSNTNKKSISHHDYLDAYWDSSSTPSTKGINKDSSGTANCCCSDSYWDTLVDSDVLTGTQIMDYFMWTNRSSCRLAHDFGGKILENPSGKDGQKAVCIDPQVAPKPEECLVYSFGINSEWSFDEEMEQYGCQVFAFDPSMAMEPHDHTPGIHFYNWGLGERDEILETSDNVTKWQMYSLSSIYKTLSVRHGPAIIDYLKMDIEGSEWKVLPDLIKTGMLSKVRQLGLEIHLPEDYPVDGFRKLIRHVRALESMGMVRFDSKYNPWYISNFTHLQLVNQPAGYEIAWYNSQLLSK